jgi:hypothetical protein
VWPGISPNDENLMERASSAVLLLAVTLGQGLGKFLKKHPITALSDLSTAEFIAEDKIAVHRRMWTRVTIAKSMFTAVGAAGDRKEPTSYSCVPCEALRHYDDAVAAHATVAPRALSSRVSSLISSSTIMTS